MSIYSASIMPLEKICDQPRVYVMDGFASVQELAPLIEIVRSPAELTRRGFATHRNKAGLSFEWEVATEPLLKTLTERTYACLGFDNALGLTLRFRNYQVGEYHPGHLDAYQADNLYLVTTAIIYLNDTAQGGETRFPQARPTPLSIAPKAGRLAVWFNYTPEGERDPLSFHDAQPILAGEKLTLTNFIYKPLEFAKRQL